MTDERSLLPDKVDSNELYDKEGMEKEELEGLELFLRANNTGLKKDYNLESFADSTIAWSFTKYEPIVDKVPFVERADLVEAAKLGIILGWRSSNPDHPSDDFLSYKISTLKRYYNEDKVPIFTEKASDLKMDIEEFIETKIRINYLYNKARKEVNKMLTTAGIGIGTINMKGNEATKPFTDFDTDEDGISEDYIERLLHRFGKQESDASFEWSALAFHNAIPRNVIKAVSGLLDIDPVINFPERYIEEDTLALQKMFLDSIKKTVFSDRGYSGLSPAGNPRYRKMDKVSATVEEEVIDSMFYDGERSIGLAYLRSFLKEQPVEWGYAFAKRGIYGGSAVHRNYHDVRDEVTDFILERERTDNGTEWIADDRTLLLKRVPKGLITDLCSQYPEIRYGVGLRKKAWQRISKMLLERSDELIDDYTDNVRSYLTQKRGGIY